MSFFDIWKFSKLSKFTRPEDLAEKFTHQFSSAFMLVCIAILFIRQYVFKPISCWIPYQWHGSWRQFAENYCWIQNTYYFSVAQGPPKLPFNRESAQIIYYQWVSFVLALQVLLINIPHFLWSVLASRYGIGLHGLIVKTCKVANCFDAEERRETLECVAQEIIHLIQPCPKAQKKLLKSNNDRQSTHSNSKILDEMRPNMQTSWQSFRFLFHSSKRLVYIYMAIKLGYLVILLGQIGLMQHFINGSQGSGAIQPVSYLFGIQIATNLLQGRGWRQTGHFPRVSWCDVQRRVVANLQRTSFICVLPLNMLHEKIYVFLWFWTAFCVVAMLISLVVWLRWLIRLRAQHNCIQRYAQIGLALAGKLPPAPQPPPPPPSSFLSTAIVGEHDRQTAGNGQSNNNWSESGATATDDWKWTRQMSDQLESFSKQLARSDGMFVVSMIARSAGEMLTAELVLLTYLEWYNNYRIYCNSLKDTEYEIIQNNKSSSSASSTASNAQSMSARQRHHV